MTSARHHNIYIDGAACFWTSSVIDKLPVFRSRTACITVLDTLDKCRRVTNVKLLGYVLMLAYIHQNPIRRGLIDQAEDWGFSSAAWYTGGESIIIPDEFDF
ncbi:MAG: hypothetical protein ABFD46_13070 [Armatimonadota bacterium]